MHKSVVSRLASALHDWGMIEKDSQTRKLRIGEGAFRVGSLFSQRGNLVRIATPHMEKLVAATGQSSHLSILEGLRFLVVATVESPSALRVIMRLGERRPLHCTAAGKLFLANSDELLDAVLAGKLESFTPQTLTLPAKLRKVVAAIQKKRSRGMPAKAASGRARWRHRSTTEAAGWSPRCRLSTRSASWTAASARALVRLRRRPRSISHLSSGTGPSGCRGPTRSGRDHNRASTLPPPKKIAAESRAMPGGWIMIGEDLTKSMSRRCALAALGQAGRKDGNQARKLTTMPPSSKSTVGIVVKAQSEQQDGRLCSLNQSMRLLLSGCTRDCH